ncbi:MAG: acetyl-CoA carboxylase biotin carboxyl carrier protein [Sphingopyxis sp.]|uniref:acetyl-CoA carboxylase biotin carboxyl carrier protein n=1 Tax=Sphingopyxis sp. TaxID=1908224 RepID=UPI003D6CBF7E
MSSGEFPEKLTFLLQEFERSSLREVHIRRGDIEIHLSRGAASARSAPVRRDGQGGVPAPTVKAPAAAPAAAAAAAPAADPAANLPPGGVIITAPNIGTFYRSPKPGSAPYVEVGDTIAEGDELCLIEVMKLFTALKSDKGGRIHSILVEDGVMVEGGQPLFVVVQG